MTHALRGGRSSRKGNRRPAAAARAALGLAVAALAVTGGSSSVASDSTPPGVSTVISELNEPRGLLVTGDGSICVAEAGFVDEVTTDVATIGRIDTTTGSISCRRPDGAVETLIDGLAYVKYPTSGVSTGPADVAELDGRILVLVGESFGPGSRTLSEVQADGDGLTVVADLLAFAHEQYPDALTDGLVLSNPFAMLYQDEYRRFLITDGATGHVVSAGLDGSVEVFSRVEGHHVLTGIASEPGGAVHVASFSPLPHPEGAGSILRLDVDGRAVPVVEGLTMPIDLAFDREGRMLVLEFAGGSEDDPYGGTPGSLLRLSRTAGGWSPPEVLIDGLEYPTALAVLDDGGILLSLRGAFSEPGSGEVVRVQG